jgi:DNA-binding transcriptional ArsR family regulator
MRSGPRLSELRTFSKASIVEGVGTTAQTGIADGRTPAAPTPGGAAPGSVPEAPATAPDGATTPEAAVHDARACLAADEVTSGPCNAAAGARDDLTWLLHRCAQRMRGALDEAARERGLNGARDWIVLSAIAAGPRQTQLALAQALGLDKTTMTSLLDRLESAGLVTRYQDSRDRRARDGQPPAARADRRPRPGRGSRALPVQRGRAAGAAGDAQQAGGGPGGRPEGHRLLHVADKANRVLGFSNPGTRSRGAVLDPQLA